MKTRRRSKGASDLFDEMIVDNFAGGGGASLGIERALRRAVDLAINHDRASIDMPADNDWEALDKIRAAYAESTDKLHHAPLCPANHFHGGRAPTGPCTCGAVALEAKKKTGAA